MKKLISILLVIAMMAAFAACGNKANEGEELPQNAVVDTDKNDTLETENKTDDKKEPEVSGDPVAPNTSKPADEQIHHSNKPAENKPAQKPVENKPAEKPAENKPAEKPAETPKTMGNILLADFRQKASGMGVLDLANALIENPIIQFKGGTMLEEGVVTKGFTGEITGYKSAARFEPMMGSIAFIGYVFELENASETASFISNLRAKADPSWNICVTADETVTGSVGNKVFFVMCPIEMN